MTVARHIADFVFDSTAKTIASCALQGVGGISFAPRLQISSEKLNSLLWQEKLVPKFAKKYPVTPQVDVATIFVLRYTPRMNYMADASFSFRPLKNTVGAASCCIFCNSSNDFFPTGSFRLNKNPKFPKKDFVTLRKCCAKISVSRQSAKGYYGDCLDFRKTRFAYLDSMRSLWHLTWCWGLFVCRNAAAGSRHLFYGELSTPGRVNSLGRQEHRPRWAYA